MRISFASLFRFIKLPYIESKNFGDNSQSQCLLTSSTPGNNAYQLPEVGLFIIFDLCAYLQYWISSPLELRISIWSFYGRKDSPLGIRRTQS